MKMVGRIWKDYTNGGFYWTLTTAGYHTKTWGWSYAHDDKAIIIRSPSRYKSESRARSAARYFAHEHHFEIMEMKNG